MVEGAPLLREYTGNGIEGSNPFVSATHHFYSVAFDVVWPLMGLFLLANLHSLLLFDSLRLDSFLFIAWYNLWYFEGVFL